MMDTEMNGNPLNEREPTAAAPAPEAEAAETPAEPVFLARDRGLAFLAYGAALLMTTVFLLQSAAPRLGVLLTGAVWTAVFLWHGGKPAARLQRAGAVMMAAGLTLALSLVLNANRSLYLLNLLAVAVLLGAGAGLAGGMGGLSWKRPRVAVAAVFYTIGLSFVSADKFFAAIGGTVRNKKFWKIALGVLLSVPVLGVVLSLLSSADRQFGAMTDRLSDLWPAAGRVLARMFWAIPPGALFYSLFYGLRRGRTLKNVPMAHDRPAGKNDGVIFATLLGLLCAVYAVFIYVQFAYLFSRALPLHTTYAEYARSGFFELAFVTLLNLGIALCAVSFTKDRAEGGHPGLIRALCGVLLAFTLVILASAAYRMVMYVDVYGLTVLRFFVLWGELVMLAGILLTGAKTLKPDFKVFPALACMGLALYLALNLCNMDALIANYNVDLYLADPARQIDVNYLSRLSPDAWPALNRLDAPPDSFDHLTYQAKNDVSSFWGWNVTSWRVTRR